MAFGRLVQEVRRAQAADAEYLRQEQRFPGLQDVFEKQKRRIQSRLGHAVERVEIARRKERLDVIETPAGECVIERRGHSHGHDKGVDWRERNI